MAVHVFLHSHYADWELGYLLPELIENKREVITFGLKHGTCKSLGSLEVTVQKTFDEIKDQEPTCLILPGGDFWPNFENKAFDHYVLNLHQKKIPIAAICAATTYLARLGILDQTNHTSNSLQFLKEAAPQYQGASYYKNQLAITGDRVITASGFAAVEFTLEVLKLLQVYSPKDCDIWYRAFKHGEYPVDG